MIMQTPSIKLSSGNRMPLLGLGTWCLSGEECYDVVKQALDFGYRHIDTAHSYDNQTMIGKAIEGFPRHELFLTSKIPLELVEADNIEASVERIIFQALEELKTDYLDLYLIHHPDRTMPMGKILRVLNRFKDEGKIKSVGVSNFTAHHLQDILAEGIEVSVNQVEFHPYLYQKELLDFCRSNKITLSSYRSFGKGAILDSHDFQKLAKKYNKTEAQIILRWLVQKEIPVIPKASTAQHLKENKAIFDFALTHEDMRFLDTLNKDERFCSPEWADFAY